MIGILAERPILLSGDIGTGKTFIIAQLANLIWINLKVIQFNYETSSLDIIWKLELTIDKNKINSLKSSLQKFINSLIDIKYWKITEIIAIKRITYFTGYFIQSQIEKSFSKIKNLEYNGYFKMMFNILLIFSNENLLKLIN